MITNSSETKLSASVRHGKRDKRSKGNRDERMRTQSQKGCPERWVLLQDRKGSTQELIQCILVLFVEYAAPGNSTPRSDLRFVRKSMSDGKNLKPSGIGYVLMHERYTLQEQGSENSGCGPHD